MPASAYDRSPIAPGEYQHERRTYNSYRVSRGANGAMLVEMFTMGTDPENPPNYVVRFDRLDDEFYLIQAVQTGGAGDGQIDYELIRIDAEGFTEVRVPCSAAFDQRIAVAAGASVRPDGDRECVFKSYEAVVAAAHGVAAELRRRDDTIGRYVRR